MKQKKDIVIDSHASLAVTLRLRLDTNTDTIGGHFRTVTLAE